MKDKAAIIPTDNTVVAGSFKITPVGIDVIGEPTFNQWLECGRFLYKSSKSLHFLIGDWLLIGEFRWKDTYREAVERFGFEIQTLRNDKWIAQRIPLERRREDLSFSHHKEVADLEEEEQEELLEKATKEKLSTRDLIKLIQKHSMNNENSTKKVSPRGDTSADKEPETPIGGVMRIGRQFHEALKSFTSSDPELNYNQKEDLKELLEDIATIANEELHIWDQ